MMSSAHAVEIAQTQIVENSEEMAFEPLSADELQMIGGGGSITNTL